MKTSNKFTLARMIGAPVIFFLYNIPRWIHSSQTFSVIMIWVVIVLLAFVELTDYLDGHYARLHNEVSDFGKMFDPFADVFLHLSMFTCFVFSEYMPVSCYVLILCREFSQNFLRMISAKRGTAIAARKGGKIKTVFYVASCFIALVQEAIIRMGLDVKFGLNMHIFKYVGWGFFSFCVVLAYFSFFDYMKNFGKVFKEEL